MLRRSRVFQISAYEFGHSAMTTSFGRDVRVSAPAAGEAWGPVQRTKMPNGATIVSQDRRGSNTSIGMFFEAGPKFDPPTAPGLSYAMRWAGLTSNMDESLFQIDKALRAVGAAYGHTEVNKRHIGYIAEVARSHWAVPLEKMQACFAVPRFTESDVERFRDTWDAILEEMRWQNPRAYCAHQIELLAFFREPLGNPRFMQPTDNDRCSASQLLAHYCKFMAPQRLVVAGINVEHNELISAYQNQKWQMTSNAPHFSQALLEASPIVDEAKQFTPGREIVLQEGRAGAMGTHPDNVNDGIYALAWLTYGADRSAKEYATALVCRAVLDGIFLDSLRADRSAVHFGTRTFYHPYSTAGLLGLTVRQPCNVPGKLAAEVAAALTSLPAGKVTSADLARATARAATAFHHDNLDTQRDALTYLATATFPAEAVLDAVRAVTVDDVNNAFAQMKAAKPVAFSTGGVADIPSLRSMLNEYKL